MQGTATTPRQLAHQLHALMQQAMRSGGSDVIAVFDELDLNLTQVKLLYALDDGGEMNVKALAGSLKLSEAATSRAVEGLIRRELLERREDPQDRRSRLVTVTARGRQAIGRITAARIGALERYAASLSDEKREALAAALAR